MGHGGATAPQVRIGAGAHGSGGGGTCRVQRVAGHLGRKWDRARGTVRGRGQRARGRLFNMTGPGGAEAVGWERGVGAALGRDRDRAGGAAALYKRGEGGRRDTAGVNSGLLDVDGAIITPGFVEEHRS